MKKQLVNVALAFLLSRILCGFFTYAGQSRREFLVPVPGGWEGIANWWLNPWTTYDSKWFLDIAHYGYQELTTSFFPLFPLLLRWLGNTETEMVIAGFIISNVCFFVALMLMYTITSREHGEKTAATSVWLLSFFPTTVFFSAVYTESLFLVLLLACFLFANQQRWLLAGIFGLLASLTRNPGFLISFALALQYLTSINYSIRDIRFLPAGAICLPFLGFLAVQAYFWQQFGGMLSGVTSQAFYHRAPGLPWEPVIKDLANIFTLRSADPVTFINVLVTILVFWLGLKYYKNLKPSYGLLMIGIILMHLTYQRTIPPYTIGAARYMSTTFPFIQLLALVVSRLRDIPKRLAFAIYISVCAVFSLYFGYKVFLG